MFTIHQVRLGLATNSSSTHSLILIPGGAGDYDAAEGRFGWGFFTCGSKEAKLLYVATQLQETMSMLAGTEVAQAVVKAWTGTEEGLHVEDSYVDHQSRWSLPLDWEGKSVDKPFFDDLMAYLLREDVVVLGGNDNTDLTHPLNDSEKAFQIGLPLDSCAKSLVCRKDEDYWVLFNRDTGTKIRMSFTDPSCEVNPVKGATPELVDVKITDFCPYGCSFCYQDSTVQGEHADMGFLSRLAWAFQEMRVFEVAIGGGEPTLHPHFVSILEMFQSHGIVPNFTTKNLTWLNDHHLRPRILKAAGAFAYSIESAAELNKLAKLRKKYDIPNTQLNCQYVMGSTSIEEFERLLEASAKQGIRTTLLGYKTDGRGDQFHPEDYSKWTEVLKRVHDKHRWNLKVGIDTALASEYQDQIVELGVPKWCYELQEGKFSMYVDAVSEKTAKSSYGSSLAMRPIKGNIASEINKHFASF